MWIWELLVRKIMTTMKSNIFILVIVLSIPFALSSQTRKAIPAGRYEALSGIKVARNSKNQETISSGLTTGKIFWQEVEKHFPVNAEEIVYVNLASMDFGIKSKNFHEAKNIDQDLDLLVTADLAKDQQFLKRLKGQGIIVLRDSRSLEKMMTHLKSYEVLSFHSEKDEHFYLLKRK